MWALISDKLMMLKFLFNPLVIPISKLQKVEAWNASELMAMTLSACSTENVDEIQILEFTIRQISSSCVLRSKHFREWRRERALQSCFEDLTFQKPENLEILLAVQLLVQLPLLLLFPRNPSSPSMFQSLDHSSGRIVLIFSTRIKAGCNRELLSQV